MVIEVCVFASYIGRVLTLTPTKARANLSALLKKALEGEEIGIVCNGRIVALRPVEVTATDYLQTEYGISTEEFEVIAKNLHAKAKEAIENGTAKTFTGDRSLLGRP